MGERKFDGYLFGKNWELENGKKSGFWRSKKYLKLVILEKNSSGRQYQLCKIHQHAELSVTMREKTQGLKVNKH